MKLAGMVKDQAVKVNEVTKPTIQAADDVILHIVRACVCGSDLWNYRGIDHVETGHNSGHEAIAIVEAVGDDITTVKPGDFVIAPFTHGCGHCAACINGFDGGCLNHQDNFSNDAQAEYMRYQHAQWSLIKVPGQPGDYSEGMLKSLLTLSDVMPTGYHAAKTADVKRGDKVVVVGDGAVGLCAVISAKMLGAAQIIIMSRHEDRQKLAREFGATDVVADRGEAGIKQVLALTGGTGADAVLECVGAEKSTEQAMAVVRPGGTIGRVGLPHMASMNPAESFYRNVKIAGGPASVTTYVKGGLLKAVLDGQINPGKVFTKTFTLDEVDAAYQAMDKREAIKSYLVVSD